MKKSCVIIHHSATADSGTLSWQAIRRYHVDNQGWRDIGYHAGIELVGSRYEVLLGRSLDEDGAHCWQAGMNRNSVGWVFVGDYDSAPPDDAMLRYAARHLAGIMFEIGITPDKYTVFPHSRFAPKSCPGIAFPFDKFLNMLRGG